MPEPSADETARRLRAMWGYSGLQQDKFVKRIPGANEAMLRTKGATKAPPSVLRAAAKSVDWSTAFADEGPAAIAPAEATTAARVDELVDAVLALASGDATTALAAANRALAQPPAGTAQDADAPDHPWKRPADGDR